jgi:predicted GNAT family N-acyltransferase
MIMSTPVISARLAVTGADRAAVLAIREQVFVQEQGVPYELEMDDLDAAADHFVARLGDRAVGAGRLVVEGDTGVLGRLAVSRSARRSGLGAALVSAIEDRARERGLTAVVLHAQTHARAFYARLGYVAEGGEYEEAGIPHISMRKPM